MTNIENQKNIETCLPESILAEVASVPTDPQFVSMVNESIDPLKQQAFQQAGSDAYNEVVASHQPYTFTSQVAQMKSNLILLLRRFWRFPFGSGTLRSLSDMWAHYINRLQGSETYGIPSRLDQLTDLPSAPLLVSDRKISGADCQDGMSVVQLFGSSAVANAITELTDDNVGWTMDRSLPTMNGVTKATISCKTLHAAISGSLPNAEELTFPDLDHIDTGETGAPQTNIIYGDKVKKIYMPALKRFRVVNASYMGVFYNLTGECEIYMENCEYMAAAGGGSYPQGFSNIQGVTKIVFGTPHGTFDMGHMAYGDYTKSYNLIHLEIGAGADCNIGLANWNPTDVLADQDNLQQFLQNFRSFIVLRLANRKTTTALTLTLSANVYNAVTGANSGWASQHTLAELGITDNDLTDLETELGITSATIYATWLDTYTGANGIHWDINKAN